MQAAYGAEVNQVYLLFGRLEVTAIRNGNHDLAVADNFKTLGIGLLIGVFALVIGIMGYFARRLTKDVVRPVEMLQAAAGQLRAGSLEHRVDCRGCAPRQRSRRARRRLQRDGDRAAREPP